MLIFLASFFVLTLGKVWSVLLFSLLNEDFCKRISSKSKSKMESSSSSEEEEGGTGGKNEEDEFIHHPFKVKDTSSIVLNIRVGGQIIFFLVWVFIFFL